MITTRYFIDVELVFSVFMLKSAASNIIGICVQTTMSESLMTISVYKSRLYALSNVVVFMEFHVVAAIKNKMMARFCY